MSDETRLVRIKYFFDSAIENEKAAVQYGLTAIRSLIIVNGGALVALLAFLGNVEVSEAAFVHIERAFLALCLGLVTSLLAALLGYIAQSERSVVSSEDADRMFFNDLSDDANEEKSKTAADRARRTFNILRWVAIIVATISIVLFVCGVWEGALGLTDAP